MQAQVYIHQEVWRGRGGGGGMINADGIHGKSRDLSGDPTREIKLYFVSLMKLQNSNHIRKKWFDSLIYQED